MAETKRGGNALTVQMSKTGGREALDVKLGTHELVLRCCGKINRAIVLATAVYHAQPATRAAQQMNLQSEHGSTVEGKGQEGET